MKVLLILTAIHALRVEEAVDQISSSVQKALGYSPYSSIGIKFNSIVPNTIMDHYYAFKAIEHPTKTDLVSAIYDSTVDLQLKTVKILQNSLLKRDFRLEKEKDQIAKDITDRKDFLLQNDEDYQRLAERESDLQDSAFDQQALDFENFLDSLESDEPMNHGDYLDLVLDIVQVQLEKDTTENNILDKDEELKELHTNLVNVDPNHIYLQNEKSFELAKLFRQVSSARIILESFCHRIGIEKSTLNHLKGLSNRMDKLITKNPHYTSREKSPVAKELQRMINSSPNSSKAPMIITITMLIGMAAPPVLLAMFATESD